MPPEAGLPQATQGVNPFLIRVANSLESTPRRASLRLIPATDRDNGSLLSNASRDRELSFRLSLQPLRSHCNPAPQRRYRSPREIASSCLRASGLRGCLA